MLVLLHPFPFDSRALDGLHRRLPDVLTPDLRGVGKPDLGVLADQVVAAMDTAGVHRAVIGGVSMGGYIAAALLERHPDRCAGIVLIDSKTAADDAIARANRLAVAERADRGTRPVAAELLTGMLARQTFLTRPGLTDELARIIDAQPTSDIAWKQRAMAARPDRTALLAGTAVPVLIIAGAHDALTPPAASAALAATIGAEFAEIADAGHLAVAEQPDEVAAAIDSWLDRTDLRRDPSPGGTTR